MPLSKDCKAEIAAIATKKFKVSNVKILGLLALLDSIIDKYHLAPQKEAQKYVVIFEDIALVDEIIIGKENAIKRHAEVNKISPAKLYKLTEVLSVD